jgi:predicted acyltransferase
MNSPSIWSRLSATFVSRSLAGRDVALDVFRGLAIIGMILVNHAPPGETMYAPFVHAEWNGWSLADTIFPAFLFAVGVSIAWVLPGRDRPSSSAVGAWTYWRIIRRAALLIILSVLLVNFPYYEWAKLRVAGVLAHIGWCYLIVSIIHINLRWRGQLAVTLLIMLAQWLVLTQLHVPGFGSGVLTPEGNASRYIDQAVLGPNAFMFDMGEKSPYGLLVIFSSLSTTLIGVLAGHWLRSDRPQFEKVLGLFASGCTLFVLANAWDAVLPINKLMWTSSFVALTAGISLVVLGMTYWALALDPSARWAWPLKVAGVNALAFYIFAQLLQRVLVYGRLRLGGDTPVRLRVLIYERLFTPWISGQLGALIYTVTFLLVCFCAMVLLYRRRIFVRL